MSISKRLSSISELFRSPSTVPQNTENFRLMLRVHSNVSHYSLYNKTSWLPRKLTTLAGLGRGCEAEVGWQESIFSISLFYIQTHGCLE